MYCSSRLACQVPRNALTVSVSKLCQVVSRKELHTHFAIECSHHHHHHQQSNGQITVNLQLTSTLFKIDHHRDLALLHSQPQLIHPSSSHRRNRHIPSASHPCKRNTRVPKLLTCSGFMAQKYHRHRNRRLLISKIH